MKVPNEQVLHHVKQWLIHGDEDLRLAEHAMTLKPEEEPPYRLIAYHAQQCAEKYLKAYLVYCVVDFPYTHNISVPSGCFLNLCLKRAYGKLIIVPQEINYIISIYPNSFTALHA